MSSNPARLGVVAFAAAMLVATPRSGSAEEPALHDGARPGDADALAPLLVKLSHHAERFEEMKRRGCFTLSGRMEELDRHGHVDVTKEMVLRVTATPSERRTEILKYTENNADKTAEARAKAEAAKAANAKDAAGGAAEKRKGTLQLHLPFLPSEQPRYVFALAERDAAVPTRVRMTFRPLAAAEDAFRGSAWVDETTGEVLTMGFSPSKTPMFVDQVDVTMRFDLTTPLGRAPSSVVFDARGGFLVVHKHYRGSATISDARLGF